jgi:NADH-quinone oxidoreductase subunit J
LSIDMILFTIIATLTGLSALAVVFTKDIVRCAVWLLFTLVGVSLIYFLLGAEFVGATQLIVYVGGTMVLVVFGVMLTAQQQFLKIRTARGEWLMAAALSVGLLLTVARVNYSIGELYDQPVTDTLPGVSTIGVGFLQRYILPFEIISVHLLVVLIGAAYLARPKRNKQDGGP